MHGSTFVIISIAISVAIAANGPQIITIDQAGCTFLVNNSNNFTFIYCNTPNQLAQNNWTQCLAECCPKQSSEFHTPSMSALTLCQIKKIDSQNISLTTIIIFAVIAVIALAIFICFCAIILKLLKSLYRNRVMQEIEDNLPIQWEQEQKYLTADPAELKWCKKSKSRSKMAFSDSTCSICLEEHSNAELFCKHIYHPACIGLWLNKSNFCPLCHREDIRSIKIYCSSCLLQYIICRKKFLLTSGATLPFQCVQCSEGHKDLGIEIEDIEFQQIDQNLIFDFSSEVILSPS